MLATATSADPALELDRIDEVLLSVIFEATEPIGARMAARKLREKGPSLSEATVSRSFARLDALGLTTAVARKGRTVTELGRAHMQSSIERTQSNARFDRAMDMSTIEEIVDWLAARRVLESQAAEFAATRATDEELAGLTTIHAQLENLPRDADMTVVALQFHRALVNAASSPIFSALIGSLYTPTLLNVERALDVILHARGTMDNSATDHELILRALQKRDSRAAGLAMSMHLERLQAEAQRFADEASGESLQQTLRLISAARNPHWDGL